MKSILNSRLSSLFRPGFWLLAACLLATPPARAGLAFTVDLYVTDGTYVFYTPMNTNFVGATAPFGVYDIYSPGWPASGSWRELSFDSTNGINTTAGSEHGYDNLAAALQQITNGVWTMTLTNATATNTYHFTVSLPGGLASNQLPVTLITFPANNALSVTNLPTFTWTGQPNWPVTGSANVSQYANNGSFYCPAMASTSQSSWTIPVPIPASNPNSSTYFSISYVTNYTASLFVATTPTNIVNGQAIAGWAYHSTLESGGQINFTVVPPPAASTSHKLVAHYTFDSSGDLGLDSSPNGNNLNCGSSWGANVLHQFTTNAVVGGGAVQFFGESSITPCGGPEFTSWTNTLLGSFTVSVWIKTANVVGNDSDPLNDGDGQTVIYLNNNGNGIIPLGITGTKAAMATGVPPGAYGQDTLNSSGTVTSGSYVHVVVTRDAGSGRKQIYVNGVLDAADYGEPGILDGGVNYASIGGELSAPYTGKLDDVQIYAGVLGASEVAYLFANPGVTAADGSDNGLIAHYTFDNPANLGKDSSSNNYDLNYIGSFANGSVFATNTAIAGGAVTFARDPNYPDASSSGGVMGWTTTPANLLNTLAGNFTISVWVKTTDAYGYQGDLGSAVGIVSADVPDVNNDLIPVSLTDGDVTFNTGDLDNSNPFNSYDDTLSSQGTVNDGTWHHIVVSRTQATGQKNIYIDGVLDTSDFDTTNLLNDPQMITLGALADASQSNPTNGAYYNGYAGIMDDLQIYARTLSSNEVTYLYDNPGMILPVVQINDISLSLQLNIVRNQDPVSGDNYYCFPSFSALSPDPITTDEIHSPTDKFSGHLGGGGSSVFSSLASVVNECTNGLWTIYINKGDLSEQQFRFSVSIAGLTTNLLQAVKILSPTNGGSDIGPLPSYHWTGPAGFEGIFAQVTYNNSQAGYANLPGTATNWNFPTSLTLGTNQFYLNYFTNNVANVAFTTPVDLNATPLFSWNAQANLNSEAAANFVVTPTLPVFLAGPKIAASTFQFQFQSQNGRNNMIQARTNLTTGLWVTVTNYIGDGSLKSVTLTNSIFGTSKQGFLRVSSQ